MLILFDFGIWVAVTLLVLLLVVLVSCVCIRMCITLFYCFVLAGLICYLLHVFKCCVELLA